MNEKRVVNKIEEMNEDNIVIKVTWDIFRNDVFSHSCEQCYEKNSFPQFFTDIGDIAIQFANVFNESI